MSANDKQFGSMAGVTSQKMSREIENSYLA